MRNGLSRKVVSLTVVGCLMMGLLVSPVAARLVTGEDRSLNYPNVDAAGNLDFANGNSGVAKIYKFTRLNLLLGVGRAWVTNLSKRPQVYRDTGFPLLDPETGEYITSNDLVAVTGRQGPQRALFVVVGVARLDATPPPPPPAQGNLV